MGIQHVTNGSPDGSLIGAYPEEKIGFYGANPLPQESNSNQHLIQRDMGGQLILFASVLANATASLPPRTTTTLPLLTVPGLSPNDILLGISKLGYCFPYGYSGARISDVDTIEVTFTNPAATPQELKFDDSVWSGLVLRGITPYNIPVIRQKLYPRSTMEQIVSVAGYGSGAQAHIDNNGHIVGVTVHDQGANYRLPPKVTFISQESVEISPQPYGSGASATAILNDDGTVGSIVVTNRGSGYTVPPEVKLTSYSDIAQDQMIFAYPANGRLPDGVGVGNVRFVDDNNIGITFFNLTDEFVPEETLYYNIWGLDSALALSSILSFHFSYRDFKPTGPNFNPMTTMVPLPGMVSEDLVLNAYPLEFGSQQTAVGSWQGAIAKDNAAVLRYLGTDEPWQPPDGVINMHVLKAYSICPMIIWQQLIDPYPIPAGEVREILFSTPFFSGYSESGGFFAWASKPTHTQGITLAGCRVANSGTTIGLCLQNCSTQEITPPAEVYTFCVFPLPVVDISTGVTDSSMTSISISHSSQKLLSSHNEILRSLGLLGLIGGG